MDPQPPGPFPLDAHLSRRLDAVLARSEAEVIWDDELQVEDEWPVGCVLHESAIEPLGAALV